MTIQPANKLIVYLTALLFALGVLAVGPSQAAGGGGETVDIFDEGPSFVQMEAVTVSVIRQGKVRGFLTVAFTLELPGFEYREQLSSLRPKLEAAYHRDISAIAARSVDLNYPVDVMLVKERLQSSTDRVLGSDFAKVLMGSASIQRH